MNKRIEGRLASMALTLLLVVGIPAAQAQTPAVSATRRIPFNRTVPTDCAEKRIRLTGEFQAQYNVTRDASGETFIEGNIDADRINGLGLTSRGKYKAAGASRLESRGPSPITFNYVFNFALNKLGTTDSLMGHVKFRISVNARGGVTTNVLDANVDCIK
jgi:hypothetical protein